MSATLLNAYVSSWIAAHPRELLDQARVERLNVTTVLAASVLPNDVSDETLNQAAMLFPRHQRVALFRFFCQVRDWKQTQGPASKPAEHSAPGEPLAVPTPPNTAAPKTAAPETKLATTAAPKTAAPEVPGTVAYVQADAPAPVRRRRQDRRGKKPALSRAGLRSPHTTAELAAMPTRRARIAAYEFDVFVDTTWAQALSVAATAARLPGDPAWTIQAHSGVDKASLWYHPRPGASPTTHATISYDNEPRCPKVSFRIVEVTWSGWRSLFSRGDRSRPARVLARKIAWGFLPSTDVAGSELPNDRLLQAS